MTTTQCPICNSVVRLSNIKRHQRSKKCLNFSQQNIIPDIYSENMDNKNYGLPPLIPERPTRRPAVPPRPSRRPVVPPRPRRNGLMPLFPGLPSQNRVKEYKKRSYKPRRLVKFENVRPSMPLRNSMLFTLPSDRKERETKRRSFKPIRVLDFNEYSRPLDAYSQAKLDYYTDIKLDNKNQIDNVSRIKLSRVPDNKKLKGLITTPTNIDEKFLKFVFKALQEDNTFDIKQANRVFNALQDSKLNMLLIKKIDGSVSIRPVNDKTKSWLLDYLEGNYIMDHGYGSDKLSTFSKANIDKIVPFNQSMKINEVRSVAFFKHMNTTAIDLSRYQIYDRKQLDEHEGKSIENCYIHSLRLGGVSEVVLNRIKLDFKEGAHLPKSSFKRIAELIERNIDLTFYDQENHLRHTNYGDSKQPVLKLGIIKNHVIINEPVEYTSYSIKHYNDVKSLPNWNKMTSIGRTRTDRFIDSLTLIKTMDECKYFTPITHSQVFAENDLQIDLTNMNNEQQEVKSTEIKDYCPNIWYSDCESFVSTGKHSLYLIGCVSIDSDDVSIFNVCDQKEWKNNSIEQLAVWKWLNTITKDGTDDALCYFHNLKYDFNLLMQYLNIKGICEKDGAIYNVKLSYKGKEVELQLNIKLLSLGLAKFNKTFNLGLSKLEAISYEYYTPENNDVIVDKKVYRNALGSDKDKTTFDLIMNEAPYADSKEFNPTAYYKVYLEHDCLVLKKGLEAMNKILLDITDDRLGAYHKLTISSLTDTFMRLEGSYDGVYELTGNLREYCSRAAYGGRVHANTKYVKKLINDKPIADFDGVSLYPSAIHRLCNEVGVPTGKAKRMTNLHSNYKWCIMTVKITKVNKQQQMPIIAHRGGTGDLQGKSGTSIDYLNEAPHDPVIIDKTTLEDYIKLHQIEYQILDGIYWDGEPNKTFGNVIYHLFQERLKHKKAGNKALSNILKLMLNSSYGKCLIKTSNTKKSIIKTKTYKKVDSKWTVLNDNNISKFIGNNFHTIKELRQINDNQWEVNQVCMDKSFNRAHIAAFILSMSKRIMNEIFDIANEMGFPIFYTDTDSMHIYDEHIKPLSDEFKRIHNRELIGKQLCQFHSDFDADGYNGNITSAGFLALGKKSYIDILQCDGKIISQQHLRMKGITKEGLEHTQRKYDNTWDTKDITKMGAMPLYLDLAKGNEVKILLNPLLDGKQKVLFDISKGQIKTKDEFYRTAKF